MAAQELGDAIDREQSGLEGRGRVLVRPSGTEPKLKIYVDLRADVAVDAPLSAAEETTRARALDVARALVTSLGLDA